MIDSYSSNTVAEELSDVSGPFIDVAYVLVGNTTVDMAEPTKDADEERGELDEMLPLVVESEPSVDEARSLDARWVFVKLALAPTDDNRSLDCPAESMPEYPDIVEVLSTTTTVDGDSVLSDVLVRTNFSLSTRL